MHIRRMSIRELAGQVKEDLLEQHRDEISNYPEISVINPSWDLYYEMDDAESLFCFGVIDFDQIVGYSINFIHKHLHYSDLLVAQNDLLYVARKKRKSRAGLMLIRETEMEAVRLGADIMMWHAKTNTPLNEILLKRKYKTQYIIYSRRLK